MANILVEQIRRVIKEKHLDFTSDTLPYLGDLARVFQLKDLPFLDTDKEAAKTLFATASAKLKEGLKHLEISSDPPQIAEAEKLINHCFEMLSNSPEWESLLSEIKHRNPFTQAIRTAFIFKALTDLYTTNSIPRDQTQYLRIICNTIISPQDSKEDTQYKLQRRQDELKSKVFSVAPTTNAIKNTATLVTVLTPSPEKTFRKKLLDKMVIFFKRPKDTAETQKKIPKGAVRVMLPEFEDKKPGRGPK